MKKYSFQNYVYFSRWASYWHQLNEVLKLKPQSLLIVGKGDGIVDDILKKYIQDIKTLDIEESLNPDIVGSVEKMPFEDNSFDVVLCAEVLEHLPFEKFQQCLLEFKRVSKNSVVLSLPHWGWTFKYLLKIPPLPEVRYLWKISGVLKHVVGEHQWEIGKRGYPTRKIKKEIRLAGFEITKDYILFENPYHHFFILRIINNQ